MSQQYNYNRNLDASTQAYPDRAKQNQYQSTKLLHTKPWEIS